jgi:hypothetical protein
MATGGAWEITEAAKREVKIIVVFFYRLYNELATPKEPRTTENRL